MKRWHWLTLAILTVLSLIAEFTLIRHHNGHWWNQIPGFYIIWGFIGGIAIIFISRVLGNIFIQQDEDYYDD